MNTECHLFFIKIDERRQTCLILLFHITFHKFLFFIYNFWQRITFNLSECNLLIFWLVLLKARRLICHINTKLEWDKTHIIKQFSFDNMLFAALLFLYYFKFVDWVFELYELWKLWMMCHVASSACLIHW